LFSSAFTVQNAEQISGGSENNVNSIFNFAYFFQVPFAQNLFILFFFYSICAFLVSGTKFRKCTNRLYAHCRPQHRRCNR
jgi:hypothetical protein